MTPLRLLINGPNHTAPLTSLRDQKTLQTAHALAWTALFSLKHYEIMGPTFSYSAQFCRETVTWSQCLQCFVAAFLLQVGLVWVCEEVKMGDIIVFFWGMNVVFQLMCKRYCAITFWIKMTHNLLNGPPGNGHSFFYLLFYYYYGYYR